MTEQFQTLEEFIKDLKLFETENDVFKMNCSGVQIYPYLRVPLYYRLTERLGLNDKQVNQLKNTKIKRFKRAFLSIKSIVQSFFIEYEKCDVLMIEHPKKTFKDGLWIDEYSYYLTRSLLNSINIKVLVHPSTNVNNGSFLYPKNTCLYYDGYVIRRKFLEFFLRQNKEVIEFSRSLFEALAKRYSVDDNLFKEIIFYSAKAIAEETVACTILKKLRPKVLASVVSYGHAAAFHSVAKKLKIRSFELQHGSITENHIGYSYPMVDVSIFPDYLLTFGKFWGKNMGFPIPNERVIPVGYINFDVMRKKVVNKANNGKYILFVSQNVNVFEMANYASFFAKVFPNEKVVFKLHPKLQGDKLIQDKLFGASNLPNIDISTSNDVNIYDLFAEAKCQVGVFSTALYEGIGLGVPTVVLKLSGWEVMKKLESYGSVNFAASPEELVKKYLILVEQVSKTAETDSGNMFAHNATEKSREAVISILNEAAHC